MSLTCSLDARLFQGLMNCLNRRIFHQEQQYTNDFIAEQVFASLELDRAVIDAEISSFDQLLRRIAEENWDTAKLERLLKKTDLGADLQRVLVLFWTNEKDKIHDIVLKKSKWNNNFSHLLWRVDMRTASKSAAEINEPIALFEFGAELGTRGSGRTAGTTTARFEMTRGQVADMIATLDGIQKKIDELSY